MSRYGTYDLKYGFIPDDDCPKPQKSQTNADRIRAMTDEDMAEFIKNLRFKNGGCPNDTKCEMRNCYDCWLNWLKQEVKDGN